MALWAAARMCLHPDMARDMLFCLFFPECPIPWASDESKRRESIMCFSSTGPKKQATIFLHLLFSVFFYIFLPKPNYLREERNPRKHNPWLSNFLALHKLFLLQAFFLKQKWICRQSIKGSSTEGGSLSFWDSSEQKGSAAALWFSSLTCVSLLFTEIINSSSRWYRYLKESLPAASDMKVDFYIFLPDLCKGWWLWCLLFWFSDIKSIPRSLDSPKVGYTIKENRNHVAFTDWPCYLISRHCEALIPCLHARWTAESYIPWQEVELVIQSVNAT